MSRQSGPSAGGKLNESYAVGAVLGYLDVTAEDAKRLGLDEHGSGQADPADHVAGHGGESMDEERKRGCIR